MVRVPDTHIDLDDLNHSELALLARWCGLPSSRGIPREDLKLSLENFEPVQVNGLPFEDRRKSLSTWMKRWWSTIAMQANKNLCPDCHLCGELQVLACYEKNVHQIKPKRPQN